MNALVGVGGQVGAAEKKSPLRETVKICLIPHF